MPLFHLLYIKHKFLPVNVFLLLVRLLLVLGIRIKMLLYLLRTN